MGIPEVGGWRVPSCLRERVTRVRIGGKQSVVKKQFRNHLVGIVFMLAMTAIGSAAERSGGQNDLKWERDVRIAWQSAVATDRPLLLFLTMDDCIYCKKMKKTTLRDRQVVRDLHRQFVSVALNVKDAPDLVKRLKVKAFPTTVIIETNGDVVESISGFQTVKQLRERLHTTLRQMAQQRRETRRR